MLNILFLILFTLKLTGIINVGWLIVFFPMIIKVSINVFIFIVAAIVQVVITNKKY